MDNDQIWAYDEPHESGGNCQITMTKQQAIDWMRKTFPKYEHLSDEELFKEWLTIYWAYRYEKSK
jgi:hypothetical protein